MKKEKKKLILIAIVIVIILIIIALLIMKLVSLRKNKISLETVKNIEPEQNIITENVVENEENNIEENSASNEEEQSTETLQPEDTEEISKEVIETKESNEEKAINIAKNDWGEDSTVYFRTDGKNQEGKYIVQVRSKETTYIIRTYTIDIDTEEFTVE